MTPSRYTFVDYSPDWPHAFAEEASRLQDLLGDALVAVHHIGSTSVPGLPAKPIIDLLPVARDHALIDAATPRLVEAGYRALGEYGLPGRRYFTKDRDGLRTHNIHIYQEGDPEITRHLAFCAYLRHHPQTRDEYAAIKREGYALYPADIQGYSDHKDAWIKRVEQLAVQWFRDGAEATARAQPPE